jgi:hypothetical protein
VSNSFFDEDFFAWAIKQARLLRAGKLSGADIEPIAEKIESMGKAEERELLSRLSVLLAHLLKWQFRPGRRRSSWQVTIRNQRRALTGCLAGNPSLKSKIPEALSDAYGDTPGGLCRDRPAGGDSFETPQQAVDFTVWIVGFSCRKVPGHLGCDRVRPGRSSFVPGFDDARCDSPVAGCLLYPSFMEDIRRLAPGLRRLHRSESFSGRWLR